MNTKRASVLWPIVLITTMIWSPLYGADDAGSVRLASGEVEQPYYTMPPGFSNQPGEVGSTSVGSYPGYRPMNPFGIQLRFRSDIGNSFYDDGYQTLGAMVPIHLDPGRSLIFIEGRGYMTNTVHYGGNAGVGYRWLNPAANRMFSISGWYDNDDTNNFRYERWGLSFASLTDHGIDVRANGYIVNDRQRNFVSRRTGIPTFMGFNIAQVTETLFEVPYDGADFEIGTPVPFLGDHGFKFYAGAYFLYADGEKNAIGPKARFQGQISPSLWAQIEVKHDDTFGTNLTGAVAIDFPGGGRRPLFTGNTPALMLAQQVQREYRVAKRDVATQSATVAINPADNQPFLVNHVNNLAGPGGNGSYENPFNTLPSFADPSTDIIFVNRGDGTATNYTGGITLLDNQRLLGEGTVHTYTSTAGTFMLPGFTPGVNPLLGGTVSMAGDNTETAGFLIATDLSNGGNGIFVTADDFLIRSVGIAGGDIGIRLLNATGFGDITDTTIAGTALEGINQLNTAGTVLDLDILRTTITGAGRHGIQLTSRTTANVDVNMDRVAVTGSAINGLDADVTFFDSTLVVGITDSMFDGNFGDGGNFFRADDSTLDVDVVRTSFNENVGDGIDIVNRHGRTPAAEFDFTDSTIDDNGGFGVAILGEADSITDLDLLRTSISRNGIGGVLMNSFERVVLNGLWVDTVIADNNGDGVLINSNANLTLIDVDILRNTGDGFQVNILGAASVLLDFNGIRINNNGGHGFDFNSNFGGSLLALDIDRSADRIISQINTNGFDENGNPNPNVGDGIELRSNGVGGLGDDIFVTIDDTEVNFNARRGIDILNQEDGFTQVFVADSQISGNLEEGVYAVNTSSAVQGQNGSSSAALDATGAIDRAPILALLIERSEIDANGAPGTMGGVVLRVGTSDGGYGPAFAGGYASDGFGGVRAGLIDSMLSGNFGEDLVIETYTSTVDPITAAGTWSDTEFTVDDYESDPLARIDMVFRGNTADSIDVTGVGAFYSDPDPLFKSRDTTQTDPGPFTAGGARRRNATRLAARNGLPPATPGGGSDNFLYPGMGTSTLRIESDFDENGVNILAFGFLTPPVGVLFPGANIFGELVFQWDDSLAPGTVFP